MGGSTPPASSSRGMLDWGVDGPWSSGVNGEGSFGSISGISRPNLPADNAPGGLLNDLLGALPGGVAGTLAEPWPTTLPRGGEFFIACEITSLMYFSCNVSYASLPVFLPTILEEMGFSGGTSALGLLEP